LKDKVLEVIDRMAHEIGAVEYLQCKTEDKDQEGVLALISERMTATKEKLEKIVWPEGQPALIEKNTD
jgi:hypothetical protein